MWFLFSERVTLSDIWQTKWLFVATYGGHRPDGNPSWTLTTVAKGVLRGRRFKFRQTMMLSEADAAWFCTLLTSEVSGRHNETSPVHLLFFNSKDASLFSGSHSPHMRVVAGICRILACSLAFNRALRAPRSFLYVLVETVTSLHVSSSLTTNSLCLS